MPITKITTEIDEGTSYTIRFQFLKDEDGSPLAPNSVTLLVFVPTSEASPVWVNDRDGTKTDGLTVESSIITFDLSPDDTVIVDADKYAGSGYEEHVVRFALTYNGGLDRYVQEYSMQIRDLVYVAACRVKPPRARVICRVSNPTITIG